jgi:phage FluMu protein gp41
VIQGPQKKYKAVTGAEFTKAAMDRNFAALQAKLKEAEDARASNDVLDGGKTVSVGA